MGGDGVFPPRAREAPTTYLSTTKEPSGPVLLLFLLICSFFLYEFCFLNQNQQEFSSRPLGLSLGLQTECMGQLPLLPPRPGCRLWGANPSRPQKPFLAKGFPGPRAPPRLPQERECFSYSFRGIFFV